MKASYLKRYPLSHFVAAVVIILSLAPIPEMPQLADIGLLDKWVHFVMYGGLCLVIWWEYWRQHKTIDWLHAAIGAIVLPALLGGLLELGQAYLTTVRSGDWLDFVANCIGVLLGALVGYAIVPRVCRGWPSGGRCSNDGRQ
ncbi:MAG: VanZ family protein [Bacteroidaceae bacterium]|nr:VanZ family protein [Bacteroidaceae bacterium]